jgi:hypothetical protein
MRKNGELRPLRHMPSVFMCMQQSAQQACEPALAQ